MLTNHNPYRNQKSDKLRSDMRAHLLSAHGRVVQKGIGEAHMFLLTRAPWVEPNGSVYYTRDLLLSHVHYHLWPCTISHGFHGSGDSQLNPKDMCLHTKPTPVGQGPVYTIPHLDHSTLTFQLSGCHCSRTCECLVVVVPVTRGEPLTKPSCCSFHWWLCRPPQNYQTWWRHNWNSEEEHKG